MMKLGDYVHCTKLSPEFEFGGHRPHRTLGPHTPKTWQFAESLPPQKNQQTDVVVAAVAVGDATKSVSK